ncbi:hypothetical protein PoB_006083600 [Plakobranchus ocellatus]|uniref:Uncharacterized protein n=1 Tax=Plakobranchus ocellatus TaxID=259542 RepID=A0AAV4CR03_9GAST|nr:hypothetical protein PoB_006083600 [Plakobranchus ocellatus]
MLRDNMMLMVVDVNEGQSSIVDQQLSLSAYFKVSQALSPLSSVGVGGRLGLEHTTDPADFRASSLAIESPAIHTVRDQNRIEMRLNIIELWMITRG